MSRQTCWNFYRGNWQRIRNLENRDWKAAMQIRARGLKSYNYIRLKKLFPLPSRQALDKRFAHFKTPTGLQVGWNTLGCPNNVCFQFFNRLSQ